MQNTLSKNHGNPVRWEFSFAGNFTLNDFDEITVGLGGQTWSTLTEPTVLFVEDDTTLTFKPDGDFEITNETVPEIIGYSIDNPRPFGLFLNHPQQDECGVVRVIL